MITPVEVQRALPLRIQDVSDGRTAVDVWQMLVACRDGDLHLVTTLADACPALILCTYNYMAPLHLAVREGHRELVQFLVNRGAANPNYVTYPYRESLVTVARDRGFAEIAALLEECYRNGDRDRKEDEGGEIVYVMDDTHRRFQKLINDNETRDVEAILKERPDLAVNPLTFWGEGVLMMPAKQGRRPMVELLLQHGARVPDISKWGAWYYLWLLPIATLLLELGMNPDHMNCQHTTVLHDMAYKGDTRKATLLLDHGANVNAVDEEFRSTPLGLAARWGHRDMVALLLERGADPNLSSAPWATPLAWATRRGHADIEALLRTAGGAA